MNARTRFALCLTVAAAAAVAAPNLAQAQAGGASVCSDSLIELEQTRTTLEELQQSVNATKEKRAGLEVRSAVLVEALLAAQSEGERATITAERKRVKQELALVDRVLPPISAQVTALAQSVQEAELAYLDCVEATLD